MAERVTRIKRNAAKGNGSAPKVKAGDYKLYSDYNERIERFARKGNDDAHHDGQRS